MGGTCPRCAGPVALHEGRPFVTTSGAIELWHAGCWGLPKSRPVEQVTIVAPRRMPVRAGHVAAALGALLVVGSVARAGWRESPGPGGPASIDIDDPEVLAPGSATVREDVPPPSTHIATALEERYPVPHVRGVPLDDRYPSLGEWIHPVTDSPDLMPELASRHFGADRAGVDRPECGGGHCGVDLDGPRGRPIVAVAGGVVVRVEHHELGLDGRSGRYVRIEHDDGTLTAYMHLDTIADGLEVGDRVTGGQYIGTLGATAVYSAAPHLHFSLEIPNQPGTHGDSSDTHYVDPAPFLVRAEISRGFRLQASGFRPQASGRRQRPGS